MARGGENMATQCVRIVRRKEGRFVVPAYVVANPGDTIEFKIMGHDATATVFIPDAVVSDGKKRVYDVAPGNPAYVEVMVGELRKIQDARSKGDMTEKQAKQHWKDIGVPGEFPYAVYCHDVRDFAEGGSSPVMIVEDNGRPPN
jgi:plastocyanin